MIYKFLVDGNNMYLDRKQEKRRKEKRGGARI